MLEIAVAGGIAMFIAGIAASVWAVVTFAVEVMKCICSADDNDENSHADTDDVE